MAMIPVIWAIAIFMALSFDLLRELLTPAITTPESIAIIAITTKTSMRVNPHIKDFGVGVNPPLRFASRGRLFLFPFKNIFIAYEKMLEVARLRRNISSETILSNPGTLDLRKEITF